MTNLHYLSFYFICIAPKRGDSRLNFGQSFPLDRCYQDTDWKDFWWYDFAMFQNPSYLPFLSSLSFKLKISYTHWKKQNQTKKNTPPQTNKQKKENSHYHLKKSLQESTFDWSVQVYSVINVNEVWSNQAWSNSLIMKSDKPEGQKIINCFFFFFFFPLETGKSHYVL